MRALFLLSALALISAPANSAPLTKSDRSELTSLSAKFTGGWMHNSRDEVMSLFAADAVFIPHDGVKPHVGKAAIDWDAVGPGYADRILEEVERRVLPGLREHLVTSHFISPKTFQRDLFAYQGSAFSLAPRLTQSAWFRPHNEDPTIPGLYIVGAGTHPGAGLPGVINSAKASVGLILERGRQESNA